MLNDTFRELLPDGERSGSPLIRESSRFTVRITGENSIDRNVVSKATAELITAMNEVGKAAALTHIVTVIDRGMHRMLGRMGWAGEPLGPPCVIGGVETYAVLYELGPELDARFYARTGRPDLVMEPKVIESLRMRIAS